MQEKTNTVSKTFMVLTAIYITCLLLSNLIAGKVCLFFGMTLPAAVILFPITYILADVFTEVYGLFLLRTLCRGCFGFLYSTMTEVIKNILSHTTFLKIKNKFSKTLMKKPKTFFKKNS